MAEQRPSTIVIFGATGDLTQRKLIPALFNQYCKKQLPKMFSIVGFALEDYTLDALLQRFEAGVREFTAETFTPVLWEAFSSHIYYVQGNLAETADFEKLEAVLQQLENGGAADRLYYLAIAPRFIEATVDNLHTVGMHRETNGARKIIIEKPFGHDLATATELNEVVHRNFKETQVYRIDHYLGKETAQNILFFRFANAVFESVWNRSYIDSVQITVAETVNVGHRGGYYDTAGVMRDMIQNHMLQLLTLVAMEPPASFGADELRNEKVKVLKAVRPINLFETVRAQYNGYRETEGVNEDSTTPTYAALKLYIDNWRWQGVPFYLRSGKALRGKVTEIVVQFKQPPRIMFNMEVGTKSNPNLLSLTIQPDEGIHFRFEAKVPSTSYKTQTVDMDWTYAEDFGEGVIPEAYERLILDALHGDASLFIRSDEIEAAWRIVDPIIKGWEANQGAPMIMYPPGTWGPHAANELIAQDGFKWYLSSETT
jgi:glucose-6-phosphate 1-dehydrogenase